MVNLDLPILNRVKNILTKTEKIDTDVTSVLTKLAEQGVDIDSIVKNIGTSGDQADVATLFGKLNSMINGSGNNKICTPSDNVKATISKKYYMSRAAIVLSRTSEFDGAIKIKFTYVSTSRSSSGKIEIFASTLSNLQMQCDFNTELNILTMPEGTVFTSGKILTPYGVGISSEYQAYIKSYGQIAGTLESIYRTEKECEFILPVKQNEQYIFLAQDYSNGDDIHIKNIRICYDVKGV